MTDPVLASDATALAAGLVGSAPPAALLVAPIVAALAAALLVARASLGTALALVPGRVGRSRVSAPRNRARPPRCAWDRKSLSHLDFDASEASLPAGPVLD